MRISCFQSSSCAFELSSCYQSWAKALLNLLIPRQIAPDASLGGAIQLAISAARASHQNSVSKYPPAGIAFQSSKFYFPRQALQSKSEF